MAIGIAQFSWMMSHVIYEEGIVIARLNEYTDDFSQIDLSPLNEYIFFFAFVCFLFSLLAKGKIGLLSFLNPDTKKQQII